MRVRNLINENGKAVANQFVITEEIDGEIAFQSYDSRVCEIRGTGLGFENIIVLGCDWDYSKTTTKHLITFLQQNGIDVSCKKDIDEALKRGYLRTDEAVAIWIDSKMK